MTVQLLLAPAGAGKTAYAVAEARRQARDLSATPTVLVASALQAQSFALASPGPVGPSAWLQAFAGMLAATAPSDCGNTRCGACRIGHFWYPW